MRIAFFIGSMGRGGAERVISILANEYATKGWDVDILMLLANRVEYELHPQVKVISLVGKSSNYAMNALSWLTNIRKYIKSNKPDRVVSFVGRVNAVVLTATLGLKVPIIVSERNDPKHDGRGKLMLWYCNKIYQRARAIVFQNRYEQSCFDEALKAKGIIVPNPVQVSATKKTVSSEFVVATAGRLNLQKNHFMLIDAMDLVHKEYPQIKCRIYGEGDLRPELQEYIERHELASTVSLEGNHSDIHEKLAQCSLFVLTSEFEGLSNALIEAMMVGLPCISTDYDGVSEIIQNGQNGIIVKRKDAVALANSVKFLLGNQLEAEKLADAALRTAESYKAEIVLNAWERIIG